MPYKVIKFQNVSSWSEEKPTVDVDNANPNWEKAYHNWLNGKNPTDSSEWKKGIIAITEQI